MIDDLMVIAIDPGDMMKPYAKAMENLCNIYDGSNHVFAKGYHLCQVTAANLARDLIVPLYCEAYSTEAVDYPGSTEKLIEIIKKVKVFTGTKGTWAIDRQGDDIDLIWSFTNESLQFVTRLKMTRYLHFDKNTVRQVKAERIDRHVELNHKAHIYVTKDGKEEKLRIMVQKILILSKRFLVLTSFYNYAMADGIFELLKYSKHGIMDFKSRIGPHHDTFQLSLFPD